MNRDFTAEELKTAVGELSLDVIADWSDKKNYQDRLELISWLLEQLVEVDPVDAQAYQDDIQCVAHELHRINSFEHPDGRNICKLNMYGYLTPQGATLRVWNYIRRSLSYPDLSNLSILETEDET